MKENLEEKDKVKILIKIEVKENKILKIKII
jgi:hypothetical protein